MREALRVYILRKIGTFRGLWKLNRPMFWLCLLRDYGVPLMWALFTGWVLWSLFQ